jgi:hypothetical protein
MPEVLPLGMENRLGVWDDGEVCASILTLVLLTDNSFSAGADRRSARRPAPRPTFDNLRGRVDLMRRKGILF